MKGLSQEIDEREIKMIPFIKPCRSLASWPVLILRAPCSSPQGAVFTGRRV
jgi:hypothetical protein